MSTFLFDTIQKIGARGLGPRIRSLGFKIYQTGIKLGGSDITYETVLPNSDQVKISDKQPEITRPKLIGQGTSIMGDVVIAENCTIQFNNIIQAGPKGGKVTIGKNTIINDLVIIKADPGHIVTIGENVLIGSNAYLRNCTVKDNGVVGIGAKVYDNCVVEGMLGAGAVLLEGETVPEGEIWVGNPAQFVRRITEEEHDHNKELVSQYTKLGEIIAEEMEKPIVTQLILDEIRSDLVHSEQLMDEYKNLEMAKNEGLPYASEDFANAKRIMDMEFLEDMEDHLKGDRKTIDYPYDYEGTPRNFNLNKPNYKVHNELKGRVDTDADMNRPDYSTFDKEGDMAKPDNWTRKY